MAGGLNNFTGTSSFTASAAKASSCVCRMTSAPVVSSSVRWRARAWTRRPALPPCGPYAGVISATRTATSGEADTAQPGRDPGALRARHALDADRAQHPKAVAHRVEVALAVHALTFEARHLVDDETGLRHADVHERL